MKDASDGHQKKVFNYEFVVKEKSPCLNIPSGGSIPAHLSIISIKPDLQIKGDIEPLVGREWGEIKVGDKEGKERQISGAGQRISKATMSWLPGSVMEKGETLRVGEFGVLSTKP